MERLEHQTTLRPFWQGNRVGSSKSGVEGSDLMTPSFRKGHK